MANVGGRSVGGVRRRVAAALVLVGAAACGPMESKEALVAGKFSERQDGCELVVEASRIDKETLQVAYTFANRTDQDAFLFNLLFKDYKDGVYETDPNLVYVELGAARAAVSKKIVPVPDDMEVERPVIPCVTRVGPGEEFSETLRLKLPLKAFTPYLFEPTAPKDSPPDEAKPVVAPATFEIGYFLTREGGSLAKEVETSQGKGLHFYPFTYANQKTMKVGPIDDAVPVTPPRRR